jgi:uncharacterized protein YgbK (DUF1537 family)
MTWLVVVADDLTGASDAGVQFAQRGFRTKVWLDPSAALDALAADPNAAGAAGADVVVVDMNSRGALRDDAYARMRAFLARLRPANARRIVKKMDSTLRGNTGAELRALQETLPDAFAIVCPAFPAQGRTCRDGTLYVHDTAVDQTDFARDPFAPARSARVGTQLESAYALLSLASVRAGADALNAEIERARARGVRIAIADAETDDDLRAIAALGHVRDDVLWVGSAGLLGYICHPDVLSAAAEPVEGCATQASLRQPARAERSIVFIVGSISAMTQRQIAAFAAHAEYETELVDPTSLLDGDDAALARSVRRASDAVARGTDALIALDGGNVERALALGGTRGWDVHETSRRVREALVATADGIVESGRVGCIVLSGGDVARSFCERHGIRGLELIAEAASGIPLSRAIGANLMLVTKAGGFGHAETYHDIVTTLRTKACT